MFLLPVQFIAKLLTTRISVSPEAVRTGPVPQNPLFKPTDSWEQVSRREGKVMRELPKPALRAEPGFQRADEFERELTKPTHCWEPMFRNAPPTAHNPYDLSHYQDQAK